MFNFVSSTFKVIGLSFVFWGLLFILRGLIESQSVYSIPVRFLGSQIDEQTGLTVHQTERLDTPEVEPLNLYVFPTLFAQVQAGEIGTAYVDLAVPYIVYDLAPETESYETAIGMFVFGGFFIGFAKIFSLGVGGTSKRRWMKDAVYIRAKVVGKANSNISINKVNLPKLLVEPVDLMAIKTTGDYSVQFASGPLIPEVAKLYEDGMEVPLWVDTKNLKQHWVGVPSF